MKTRILDSLDGIPPAQWNALAGRQPFVSHAYLDALHSSGSAAPATGWTPCFLTLWDGRELAGATPLYRKNHSFGEFVFDWSWADAYARRGLPYYPKLVVQVPFTPVAGPRLLARDEATRRKLAEALRSHAAASGLSSLHVLFPTPGEACLLADAGLVVRRGVQFHWRNGGWSDFESFLASLSRDKRKKIRQERRRVADAGVLMRRLEGRQIGEQEWRFFHACYRNTYAVRGRRPYLGLEFFLGLGRQLPDNLLMVVAERDGRPIASALCLHDRDRLYGRYWGAVEDVDCLHFEACYYQPMEYCLEHAIGVFEGGAQGEHKLARGFLPEETLSAHWLADRRFGEAVARFLGEEDREIAEYRDELGRHSPFKDSG